MKNNGLQHIYEVKIAKDTYDVITASTSFYQFLGERIYYTFDMMIEENDLKTFKDMIVNNNLCQVFEMNLLDKDNSYKKFITVIKDISGENVTLELILVENVYDETLNMRRKLGDYEMFMTQFNCIYYIYTKETDTVVCFKYNPQYQELFESPVENWYSKIKEIKGEGSIQKVDEFMYALRNGVRQFRFDVSGDVFSAKDKGKIVQITGTAIYENGEYVRCVGNIFNPEKEVTQVDVRRDQLTGLIMKEDITNLAKNRIDQLKKPTTIAIIDIDDFKNVNDTYGHMKGDEVLRRCAAIIEEGVEGYGNAGRIGGDEFFIVFDYDEEKVKIRSIMRSIRNDIFAAYSDEKDGFHVSTSIGSATFPNDIDNFNDLYMLADYLLYKAKSKGKNRYIMYNPEKHLPVKEILAQGMENLGAHSRRGMSKGEIVCKMTDMVMSGETYPFENVFNDVVDYFGVERIVLYDRDTKEVVYQCGNKPISKKILDVTSDYIDNQTLLSHFKKNVLVNNSIMEFEHLDGELFEKLKKQGVLSFMHHHFTGDSGKNYVVSYESVVLKNTWNTEDMYFFRILDHILAKCL